MNKTNTLLRLRRLRREIQAEQGYLSDEQACLLFDVCQALGFCDSETHYVIGTVWMHRLVTSPVPFSLTPDAIFALEAAPC